MPTVKKTNINELAKSIKTNQPSFGFTLIEVIVSIALFALIASGLFGLLSYFFTLNRQQSGLLSDSDQARKIASQIVMQLRNAQYGNTGAYPLDTAGDQQIVFYSDVGSGTGTERVRYYLQADKLMEGITNYNGSTYDTSTESTFTVQNDVANSSGTPLFYYYDGSFTGSATQTPLAQPVNVTAVKFIKLNLQIFDRAGVSNTAYYTVTASAAIRNLKTNLGQ